jgi:hypothetical protein
MDGPVPDGPRPATPEGSESGRAQGGRIFGWIAAAAGVAIGLGTTLPWATATYLGSGERAYQRVTLGLSGQWTAPKLAAAGVSLAVLVVSGGAVFALASKRGRRITAGVFVVAAGITTWVIFGHLDLLSRVPADFRAGLPECPEGLRLEDCVGIASRPGLIIIDPAALMAVLFGTVALLRVNSNVEGEGHRSDRWVLKVILTAFAIASLLLVLWVLAQLSQLRDTL